MLFSFHCSHYFVQGLCHVLPYFIKRNQRLTSSIHSFRCRLRKEVSIQRRRKPCYSREIDVLKRIWWLSPKSKTRQHARSRGVTWAVFYPLIWLANIKTEGSTSRKSFCRFGSQTCEPGSTPGDTVFCCCSFFILFFLLACFPYIHTVDPADHALGSMHISSLSPGIFFKGKRFQALLIWILAKLMDRK